MAGGIVTERQRALERVRAYDADIFKAAASDAEPEERDEVDHFIGQATQAVHRSLLNEAKDKMKNAPHPLAAAAHRTRLNRLQAADSYDDEEVQAALLQHLKAALEDEDEQVRTMAAAALERLSDGSVNSLVKVAAATFMAPLLSRARREAQLVADVRELTDEYRKAYGAPASVPAQPIKERPSTPSERAALANGAARARLNPTGGRFQ